MPPASSMPWEEPLQKILESIEGPVAKIVAVIIIITTGLTLAFGDTVRRLPAAGADCLRPLSIAFAASFLLSQSFFSFWRRGAGLMEESDDPVAGFFAPVHRRSLTEPILLGRRAAHGRHRQRNACRRRRARPAPVARRRGVIWADRAFRGRLGREAATRQFVDVGAPTPALSRASSETCEARRC